MNKSQAIREKYPNGKPNGMQWKTIAEEFNCSIYNVWQALNIFYEKHHCACVFRKQKNEMDKDTLVESCKFHAEKIGEIFNEIGFKIDNRIPPSPQYDLLKDEVFELRKKYIK